MTKCCWTGLSLPSFSLGEGCMEIVFKNEKCEKPEVSFILLDWSCRESFHMFHYLDRQTVSRDQYEIIWIEYYGRKSPDLAALLFESEKLGRPPPIDQWIVMNIPDNVYYHKHLMYNVGIVASHGRIVTICDSDVMVRSTLVSSIIDAFDKENNSDCEAQTGIVLHLDEVRSVSRKYYPFSYPSFEDIESNECINWKGNTTTGLLEKENPLHVLNYGACMSALREDLIAVGGADEHHDYLGHVCGPYELTFRLVNAGKKEVWHQSEFLYHTWHPGTDGYNNFIGPNDGKNMSTTALAIKKTGRIQPLLENPAIRMLRQKDETPALESLLSSSIQKDLVKSWTISETQMLISLGKSAFNRADYDEAINCWNKVFAKLPKDGEIQSDLGWAHYFKKNYEESIRQFDEAIRLKPGNRQALRGRGWSLLQDKHYEEAVRAFSEALKNTTSEMPLHEKNTLWIDLGWAHYYKSNYKEALRTFDEVLISCPSDGRSLCGRGWVQIQGHRYEEAIRDFNKALESVTSLDKNTCQEIFRGRAWAKYHVSRFPEALENFSKALENSDPQDKDLLQDLLQGTLRACAKNGDFDQAVERFKKILEGLPQQIRIGLEGMLKGRNDNLSLKETLLSELGWAHYFKADYKEALRAFDETIKINPSNCRALSGRGWANIQRGRNYDSLMDLNKAIENTDSGDRNGMQETLRGRGLAHYLLGHYHEAIIDFNQAMEYSDKKYRDTLQQILLLRGKAYYCANMEKEALEDFRKAKNDFSQNAFIMKVRLVLTVYGSIIKQRIRSIITKVTV